MGGIIAAPAIASTAPIAFTFIGLDLALFLHCTAGSGAFSRRCYSLGALLRLRGCVLLQPPVRHSFSGALSYAWTSRTRKSYIPFNSAPVIAQQTPLRQDTNAFYNCTWRTCRYHAVRPATGGPPRAHAYDPARHNSAG